jgi:hypothetical protein
MGVQLKKPVSQATVMLEVVTAVVALFVELPALELELELELPQAAITTINEDKNVKRKIP